jgi:hypothetical protein
MTPAPFTIHMVTHYRGGYDLATPPPPTPMNDRPHPVIALLCPSNPRSFPGQRWVNIALRTLHLIGIAGIAAGFLTGAPGPRWELFWHLSLGTGVGLALLYIGSNALWLLQLRGLTILLKLVLLTGAVYLPPWRAELFLSMIVISSVMAHAPGQVRGYRPFPRPAGDKR